MNSFQHLKAQLYFNCDIDIGIMKSDFAMQMPVYYQNIVNLIWTLEQQLFIQFTGFLWFVVSCGLNICRV